MRTNRLLPQAAAAAVIMLAGGCKSSLLGDSISEGVIEYAMSFPDFAPDGLMAGMLPERTTLSFNTEQQSVDLSAGMGVFRTSMVVNTPEKRLDYHMSVLGKRMVAQLGPKELGALNRGSQALTIIQTDEVDTIAGYPCRKAIAIYNTVDRPEVELWYTDRIHIDDPNWFTPFSEIPGVLLRYEMVQYGIRMRLDAVRVEAGNVDKELFKVKGDHEKVAPEVLDHELEQVLSTFAS